MELYTSMGGARNSSFILMVFVDIDFDVDEEEEELLLGVGLIETSLLSGLACAGSGCCCGSGFFTENSSRKSFKNCAIFCCIIGIPFVFTRDSKRVWAGPLSSQVAPFCRPHSLH